MKLSRGENVTGIFMADLLLLLRTWVWKNHLIFPYVFLYPVFILQPDHFFQPTEAYNSFLLDISPRNSEIEKIMWMKIHLYVGSSYYVLYVSSYSCCTSFSFVVLPAFIVHNSFLYLSLLDGIANITGAKSWHSQLSTDLKCFICIIT